MIANPESTRAGLPKEVPSSAHYSIARDNADRDAAFRLVYDNYVAKGLIQPNPSRLRTTDYHLLPTTTIFNAMRAGRVICTMTLVGDAQLGLPMECIYPAEVKEARVRGLYVGEVCALAVTDVALRTFMPIFVELTRLMTQFARASGMDQLLIAVHPKHAWFYQRLMGFEQIGGLKEYPDLQNAPAVACRLDFARADRERPPCYDRVFGVPLPESKLESFVMTNGKREVCDDTVDVCEQDLLVTA